MKKQLLLILAAALFSLGAGPRRPGVDSCGSASCVQNGNLTNAVVAHWALEETSTVSRSKTNYLSYEEPWFDGPTSVAGKVGNALNFTAGANTHTTLVGHTVDFSPSLGYQFTQNAWVTQETGPDRRGITLAYDANTGFTGGEVAGAGLGPMVFRIFTSTGYINECIWTSSVTPSASAWHMYTFVIDSAKTCTGGLITGYYDGVVDGSITQDQAGPFGPYSITALWIGSGYWDYWEGKIDEVSFFNRLLTQAEVSCLYNSGSGRAWPWTGC